MDPNLLFLIGAPRSGSTLTARMLGAHSQVHAPAEPHLLPALAHLGYYERVERAAYDPIITQAAMRELVASLPGGEEDYLEALRAYTDTLYTKMLAPSGRTTLLDKTPAYALVLDFVTRLYPQARYVVLTRHPMAVWCSFVDSFFDGDHVVAHDHNPLLERYVPAIARFLREKPVPLCHVRYEEIVRQPEKEMSAVCDFADLPFEPEMVDYGERDGGNAPTARGLGDPISVSQETRPNTKSMGRWAEGLAGRPDKIQQCQDILNRLTDPDLEAWGTSRRQIEGELAAIDPDGPKPRKKKLSRYTLERKVLVALRRNIHQNALGRLVRGVRSACDVLLR